MRNLQSIVIEKKLNDRSWEEEKRVLYVAMTRAKERLILTGALKDDDKSYMGLITKAVRYAAGIEIGDETFMNLLSAKEEENLSPSLTPPIKGGEMQETFHRVRRIKHTRKIKQMRRNLFPPCVRGLG